MRIGSHFFVLSALVLLLPACGTAGFYQQVRSDKMSVKASEDQTMVDVSESEANDQGKLKPEGVSSEQPESLKKDIEIEAKQSEVEEDSDIPSENAIALKPVVISGSYLALNCEVLELKASESRQLIGCRVEHKDSGEDMIPGEVHLDVYDQSGKKIEKTVMEHSGERLWDEVFQVETDHPEALVIKGKKGDYLLPSFSFNYGKIEEYLRKFNKEDRD